MIKRVTVAFYLPGNTPIYAFSLLLGLAASAGLAWIAWQAPPGQALGRLDAGLGALFGGLAGGRLGFVLADWPYLSAHPGEALAAYLGGWGTVYRAPPGRAPCSAAWRALPARDEWGAFARRWPTQALGALAALASFGLLEWARPRLAAPGQAAALAVLALAAQMAGLSLLRADPALHWAGLRLETWAALALAGGAAAAFAILQGRRPRPKASRKGDAHSRV